MPRFSYKTVIPVMVALVAFGSIIYAQWALNLHVLPKRLTEIQLGTRWPPYGFPPWMQYPPEGSGGVYFPWYIGPEGAGPYIGK